VVALPHAPVVLLTGPSGSGKSRVARRSGLPTVNLDDFYKDAGDPTLPRRAGGDVDWDSPEAWHSADALNALVRLAYDRRVELPVYDIASDRRTGRRAMELGTAPAFVAEGIFAGELVGACRDYGILGDALCLRRSANVTFVLRLARDLREHRKPPSVLWRRGLALRKVDGEIVAARAALGARPCSRREAERAIAAVRASNEPVRR
jgi:uridine kinase